MSLLKRIIPLFLIFAMLISAPVYAESAGLGHGGGGFSGGGGGRRGSGYYTIPTTTTVDSKGNATNYYRSGPTSSAALINSANKTIALYQHKDYTVNNNTSYWNYKANVDLSNFLNSYTYNVTTNNYDIDYNTYVYNTTNNYYNITIDNSVTNYNYDIQVEYAPQYTQVTYVSNKEEINNVTNVYYYALYDGRNSADIPVNEILGLDTNYSGGNYQLVTDDPNTLSLQHFDGNYEDSSSYGRAFYAQPNRSTTYIDTGDFGKAVHLTEGQCAGVTIPGLLDHDSLCIEFQLKGSSATNTIPLYLGSYQLLSCGRYVQSLYDSSSSSSDHIEYPFMTRDGGYTFNKDSAPSYFLSGRGSVERDSSHTFSNPRVDSLFSHFSSSNYSSYWSAKSYSNSRYFVRVSPGDAFLGFAPYNYDASAWHSYRLVLTNLKSDVPQFTLYLDGDLVGTSNFYGTLSGEVLYFKPYGIGQSECYLDEFRVSTGDMATTPDYYDPPTIPFDTNKVLALPDDPEEGKVYVRSSIPVTNIRIGGVRPSNPSKGFVYIPLDGSYKGAGCQISDGTSWADVDAYLYENGSWQNVIGYRFLTVGDYDDVKNPDDAPPTPTPTPGSGSGSGSGSGDSDSDSIWDKLGNLLGATVGAFFKMLASIAGAIVDGLTNLANLIGDKFDQIVSMVLGWFDSIPGLFSGFLGFLSAIFPFLPSEIMLLLTFGIAAIVFIGILKAVRR